MLSEEQLFKEVEQRRRTKLVAQCNATQDSVVATTVGTKILADPEKCFQELISEKLLILLRDGPCLELIIVSSNFQAFLLWQEKLLESV